VQKVKFKMKKKIIFTASALLSTVIVVIYLAVTDGKTNNIPDSLEKFVPKFVKNFILNDVFIVKNLKNKIKKHKKSLVSIGLENREGQKINDILLDELYELGLKNLEFVEVRNEDLLSNKSNSFNLTTFETYHLSAGTWPHTRASAYFERHKDKIILVSKNAIFSYFDIDSLKNDKLNSKIIQNNIREIVKNDNLYKHGGQGIKDILIDQDKIYVSYSNVDEKECTNTGILVADLNLKFLNFDKFFIPPTCIVKRNGHNRWSYNSAGGRLVSYDDNTFLFSHGGFKTRTAAQDDVTVFGKNILIDKNTKVWSIFSKGHRNVQGLYYNKEENYVLSTEHGPMGGDEINLNIIKDNEVKNFGWPVASYGEHYGGRTKENDINYKEAPLKKSHKEHGFVEPIMYFAPSIGITAIEKVPNSFHKNYKNDFFVAAMGKHIEEGDLSLHHIKINKDTNEVSFHEIIPINERIRDIMYVKELNKFILWLENSASLGLIGAN
jgi:hypothetical protein